jgi:CO dehydrogenase maturation factor
MSFTIAVAGKGGSGKTTVASLIIRALVKGGAGPVLGVDADPNTNLAEAFGIEVTKTIGGVLAEFIDKKLGIPPGMTKESYLELQLSGSIEESRNVDFLVMGRKQGPGCYCYPNVLLRGFIDKLSGNYPYMVIDNEAGMEHLSRKNIESIDLFLLVADHSVKGLRAAGRISGIAADLGINAKHRLLIVNRFREANKVLLESAVSETGIEPVFYIEDDSAILRADVERISVMDLPEDSTTVRAISEILKESGISFANENV